MIKIKPIIISALAAFVLSFVTALLARSHLPIALLKAVIFAIVFGGLAVGLQFVYGTFLSEGSAPAETSEAAKPVGSKVDLVVSEEDLPDDKDAPSFFVEGKHILSNEDVAAPKASEAASGGISAAEQNAALGAAEKVRERKAAENIEKKAAEMAAKREDAAPSPPAESAGQKSAASSDSAAARKEEAPSFSPIDLAAKGGSAERESKPAPAPAAPAPQAPASGGGPAEELDELPDIGSFGGGFSSSASSDSEVIEDSEFAEEGAPPKARQTEFSDGTLADVKDAPVMAEAIRTILTKEA